MRQMNQAVFVVLKKNRSSMRENAFDKSGKMWFALDKKKP